MRRMLTVRQWSAMDRLVERAKKPERMLAQLPDSQLSGILAKPRTDWWHFVSSDRPIGHEPNQRCH